MTPPGPDPRVLKGDDPIGINVTLAIDGGDLASLRPLLDQHPGLASARILGRKGGWRTPLHVAADWPGYFPAAPTSVAVLIDAGADPNDDTGGEHPESPLLWAASSDDVDVAAALIDGGANIDTPGGSIGTPLDNAVGYGCWHVARLLVARGFPVDKLWHTPLLACSPAPSSCSASNRHRRRCRRRLARLLGRSAKGRRVPAIPPVRPQLGARLRGRDTVGRGQRSWHPPGERDLVVTRGGRPFVETGRLTPHRLGNSGVHQRAAMSAHTSRPSWAVSARSLTFWRRRGGSRPEVDVEPLCDKVRCRYASD